MAQDAAALREEEDLLEQAFACGSLLGATPSMPWLPEMVYR